VRVLLRLRRPGGGGGQAAGAAWAGACCREQRRGRAARRRVRPPRQPPGAIPLAWSTVACCAGPGPERNAMSACCQWPRSVVSRVAAHSHSSCSTYVTLAWEPQASAARAGRRPAQTCRHRSPAQRRERWRRTALRAQRPCRRLARRLPRPPPPPLGHSRPHRLRPPSLSCFAWVIVTRRARARAPASGPRTLELRSPVMGSLAAGRLPRPSTPWQPARSRSGATCWP